MSVLQVLLQIVQVLLCCAPLWIGFTLAFVVIFDDVSDNAVLLWERYTHNETFYDIV